ncbi:zinc-binding alcohol dehydrogenase family protein [Geosporobacter ferrireducens]|nr:zinc-binding alcohol dehydrogenase family protein [Geosporobacter ferrireducens]
MDTNRMKALVLEKPFRLVCKEVPTPVMEKNDVLLEIETISICGSDIHAYLGKQALYTYPKIPGHEICAKVAADKTNTFSKGDKVIVMPYLSCRECAACRHGKGNCCENLRVYGVHIEGGLAEYLSVPKDYILKVPEKIDAETAALIEPFAISAHAVKRAQIGYGDKILVAGAGPIGLGVAEIAKTYGAEVVIADTSEDRLCFVRENFEYEHTLNPMSEDYREQIKDLTKGQYFRRIIDTSGNNHSMENNIHMLAFGGRMVYVGIYKGSLQIDDVAFHKRETELLGSRAATYEDFQYVLKCIEDKKIKPEKFITHRANFSEAEQAFKEWIEQGTKVFKAMIYMK